jgi:hypothetical protein
MTTDKRVRKHEINGYGWGMINIFENIFEIKGQISNQNYHIKYLWQT